MGKPDPDTWYSTAEVAGMIGFSAETVVELIQDGKMEAHRPRRAYKVRGSEVERFLAACRVGPREEAPRVRRARW